MLNGRLAPLLKIGTHKNYATGILTGVMGHVDPESWNRIRIKLYGMWLDAFPPTVWPLLSQSPVPRRTNVGTIKNPFYEDYML
jgi:hypothetical protein